LTAQSTVQWMGSLLERQLGHCHLRHQLPSLYAIPCLVSGLEVEDEGAYGKGDRHGFHDWPRRDRS
jgi:hypothetical protein